MILGRRASYLLAWCVGCAAQDAPASAVDDDVEYADGSADEWPSAPYAAPAPDDPCTATFELGPDLDVISIPAECAHVLEMGDPDPTHEEGSPAAPVTDLAPAPASELSADE